MKTLALAALALFGSCSTPDAVTRPARVLLLGDSISMGYTSTVRGELEGQAVVVRPTNAKGRPENCAGTTKGVTEIERWLAIDGGGWDLVHFNFGLHDLKRVHPESRKNSNDPDHPRQAEPEVYKAQLTRIVDALAASGARLVFATTTPVPSGGVRPHRDPADVELYNAIARAVVEARGIPVDDLFAFVGARPAMQRPADVHFAAEGSRALGVEVARVIRDELRRMGFGERRALAVSR